MMSSEQCANFSGVRLTKPGDRQEWLLGSLVIPCDFGTPFFAKWLAGKTATVVLCSHHYHRCVELGIVW